MNKESRDLRSQQLNPLAPQFLSSRMKNLTQDNVTAIQVAEVKSKGHQVKGGLGAHAQQILNKHNK
jgi:hypothetical protein